MIAIVGRNEIKNRTMKIAEPPTADLVRPGSTFRLIQIIENVVEMMTRQISGWVRTTDIHTRGNLIGCGLVHVEGTGNPVVVGVLQQL